MYRSFSVPVLDFLHFAYVLHSTFPPLQQLTVFQQAENKAFKNTINPPSNINNYKKILPKTERKLDNFYDTVESLVTSYTYLKKKKTVNPAFDYFWFNTWCLNIHNMIECFNLVCVETVNFGQPGWRSEEDPAREANTPVGVLDAWCESDIWNIMGSITCFVLQRMQGHLHKRLGKENT